ncbi:DUF4124 domain-containing protein [Viridibacterium curvum]|uniref:DUF4124 domain-containing protein n=1 Tax=Viridibacterium curvum TaxID=1101404 RepID=UPI0031EFF843
MKALLVCGLLVMSIAGPQAHSQAYKCKQANGRVSFQDQPCSDAASGSTINLPAAPAKGAAASGNESTPKKTAEEQWRDVQSQRLEQKAREQNEKTAAYNKSVRCDNARRRLEFLKIDRPMFTRDKDGNRQYYEDGQRASMIAAAERTVAEECR